MLSLARLFFIRLNITDMTPFATILNYPIRVHARERRVNMVGQAAPCTKQMNTNANQKVIKIDENTPAGELLYASYVLVVALIAKEMLFIT